MDAKCKYCGQTLVNGICPEVAVDDDGTPFGRGGDWCAWCGADWKAEHEPECERWRDDEVL